MATQKKHELEGAPDPFPSLREEPTPTKPRQRYGNGNGAAPEKLDTSETAFPSLAPSAAPTRAAPSAWGAGGGPRIAPAVPTQTLLTERFTLTAADVELSGRDGKPATLGDALKQMAARHPKVRAEASSAAASGKRQTEFFLRSESAKELERAKRTLVSIVSPQVCLCCCTPSSVTGSNVQYRLQLF